MYVLCTGHFNIIHKNHIQLFEYAAQYGDVWVGINADSMNIKKNNEYAVPLEDRIYILESCKWIKGVIPFNEETPIELIYKLRRIFKSLSSHDTTCIV